MKIAGLMVALTMLVVGMAPLALAQEQTATGEGTAGNVTPEVTSVTAPSSVDPQTEYNFPCTVQDNNTLADIENVQLILYTTGATEDGENAVENHYVFWFDPSDNSWHSVLGVDYIVTGSCTYPGDLSVQSDNYNFAVMLSGGAKAGADWNAKWIADDELLSGDNSDTFTVTEYISLEISPNTQTFSGDPGATVLPADEEAITCTVSSGTNFDIETKLDADWSGTTYGGTIGADNTHALGEAPTIDLTTEYDNVWIDETLGQGVTKEITYTLDLPMPLRDDVYTATIYINAKKHV